ncbi:MAG: ATP synthase F1 subunit delta [Solirubrobacteraceae bacterium]|jgi:F-type H+-transporting ATPase subunit delta|nr:ATP synthase F1 subunit delta [Solirubrobacteraceae bacterium]
MEEIAHVYARSLFEVAQEQQKLDLVREQVGQVADALEDNREMRLFFFSPYFSTEEKRDGLRRTIEGADPVVANTLDVLVENHRLPLIARIRREYDRLWEDANDLLPVIVTSAVALDDAVVERIGDEIGRQTGRRVQLTKEVDPSIVGGFVVRVGNAILDASIKSRLETLRKTIAKA